MPGQKIKEVDRKKIDAKFICTVCSLLLSVPMQTQCGHLLCYECLQKLLNSPSSKCPADGIELKKDNVFPDKFTQRELMGLHLHCPNGGCCWSGTNKDLQEHLTVCDHALIECVHNQCKKKVKRAQLAQHLQKECLHRQVSCKFCNETLAFNLFQQHNVECLEVPLTCKHCGRTKLRRREMERHENVECEEIPTTCEFKDIGCDYAEVLKRKESHKHSFDALVSHVWLLLKFILDLVVKVKNLSIEIVSLVKQVAVNMKSVSVLEKRVDNLEKSTGTENDSSLAAEFSIILARFAEMNGSHDELVGKLRRFETELREKDLLIVRMREMLGRIDASMAETTAKLCEIGEPSSEGQKTTSFNGILLWRIDDFAQKCRDAVSSAQTAIYSPSFCTSQFGYKMCARIYMNGDGFGKETHISLFFVVMKGEHDALLPWPFQKKITMMMLDQNKGDHMIDAFRSDPESSSFQRPTNNMNIASGSPLFMPLDGLNNRGYVKDDTMFIKITVD